VSTPLAPHFKSSAKKCGESDDDLGTCQKFHTLVMLGHSCMLWFALVLIYLMLIVLSVDTWLILVKSIGKLFSGFLDICVVLLVLVCALVNLEMVCFDMLIQIILVI
jgi:hypothetical protein